MNSTSSALPFEAMVDSRKDHSKEQLITRDEVEQSKYVIAVGSHGRCSVRHELISGVGRYVNRKTRED